MGDDEIFLNAVGHAWRATLPNRGFELDRTLADAGVDSLKAMELVMRIERALDRKVPYALLTAETTPRSLALSLSRGAHLTKSTGRPQLFFLEGIGGHILDMVRSWQTIVEEMQVVLVDAPGLNHPRVLLADLPATAAEVAAEIARRQPVGDIRLMGYSYGAALAYEVSRHFQAQGRRVAFLGLIDLMPVRGLFMRMAYAICAPAAFGRKLAGRLPRATQRAPGETLLVQVAFRADLLGLASRLARNKAKYEGLDTATADRLEMHYWRAKALRGWRPEPIDSPALLIASDDGVLAGSPQFWQKKITGLKVACVPGSHHDLTAGPADATAVRLLREGLGLLL